MKKLSIIVRLLYLSLSCNLKLLFKILVCVKLLNLFLMNSEKLLPLSSIKKFNFSIKFIEYQRVEIHLILMCLIINYLLEEVDLLFSGISRFQRFFQTTIVKNN